MGIISFFKPNNVTLHFLVFIGYFIYQYCRDQHYHQWRGLCDRLLQVSSWSSFLFHKPYPWECKRGFGSAQKCLVFPCSLSWVWGLQLLQNKSALSLAGQHSDTPCWHLRGLGWSCWHYSCEVSLGRHTNLVDVICQKSFTNSQCLADDKEEGFCSLLQFLPLCACSLRKLHTESSWIHENFLLFGQLWEHYSVQ